MNGLVVTAKELTDRLADIIEKHGDIPVVIASEGCSAVESVGRPGVVAVNPAGTVGGFQAYNYAHYQDAHIEAILID